jgi:hypothetical protein
VTEEMIPIVQLLTTQTISPMSGVKERGRWLAGKRFIYNLPWKDL